MKLFVLMWSDFTEWWEGRYSGQLVCAAVRTFIEVVILSQCNRTMAHNNHLTGLKTFKNDFQKLNVWPNIHINDVSRELIIDKLLRSIPQHCLQSFTSRTSDMGVSMKEKDQVYWLVLKQRSSNNLTNLDSGLNVNVFVLVWPRSAASSPHSSLPMMARWQTLVMWQQLTLCSHLNIYSEPETGRDQTLCENQ